MSKITNAELKAALEVLFDSGEFEIDVADDVKREVEKRLLFLARQHTEMVQRVTALERTVAELAAKAGVAAPTPPPARIDAIAAAHEKAKAAKPGATAIKVTLGGKKEVAS